MGAFDMSVSYSSHFFRCCNVVRPSCAAAGVEKCIVHPFTHLAHFGPLQDGVDHILGLLFPRR